MNIELGKIYCPKKQYLQKFESLEDGLIIPVKIEEAKFKDSLSVEVHVLKKNTPGFISNENFEKCYELFKQ